MIDAKTEGLSLIFGITGWKNSHKLPSQCPSLDRQTHTTHTCTWGEGEQMFKKNQQNQEDLKKKKT